MALTSIKITDVDLSFVKEYIKVDYPDNDILINSLILAAQSYINTMLGFKVAEKWPVKEDIPEELTIVCLMIVAHWYDNRQVQQVGTLGDEIKFAVSALIDAHKEPFKETWTDTYTATLTGE